MRWVYKPWQVATGGVHGARQEASGCAEMGLQQGAGEECRNQHNARAQTACRSTPVRLLCVQKPQFVRRLITGWG
jgi:hypothetical protein